MLRALTLSLLLSTSMTAIAQDAAPANADTFEREVLKTLKASFAAKRGVVVHIGGRTIPAIAVRAWLLAVTASEPLAMKPWVISLRSASWLRRASPRAFSSAGSGSSSSFATQDSSAR